MTLAMKMLTLLFSIASAQLENDPFYDTLVERLLQEQDDGTAEDVKVVSGSMVVDVDMTEFEANKDAYKTVFQNAVADVANVNVANVTISFPKDSTGARRLTELTVNYEIKVDDASAAETLSTDLENKTTTDFSEAVTKSASNNGAVSTITVKSVDAVIVNESTSNSSTESGTSSSKAFRHAGTATSFASVYVLALAFFREHR